MSRHMTERTTVRLPRELLLRAKQKAASQGRTLTALIEDGLRLVVAEQSGAAIVQRRMPPISNATGGLMPGVDLSDYAALQDEEDLAQVARLRQFQ